MELSTEQLEKLIGAMRETNEVVEHMLQAVRPDLDIQNLLNRNSDAWVAMTEVYGAVQRQIEYDKAVAEGVARLLADEHRNRED